MKYSVNIDEEIKTFEMYSWYIYIFFSVYPYDKNDQLSSLLLVCSLSKQAVEPQRIARQKKKKLAIYGAQNRKLFIQICWKFYYRLSVYFLNNLNSWIYWEKLRFFGGRGCL